MCIYFLFYIFFWQLKIVLWEVDILTFKFWVLRVWTPAGWYFSIVVSFLSFKAHLATLSQSFTKQHQVVRYVVNTELESTCSGCGLTKVLTVRTSVWSHRPHLLKHLKLWRTCLKICAPEQKLSLSCGARVRKKNTFTKRNTVMENLLFGCGAVAYSILWIQLRMPPPLLRHLGTKPATFSRNNKMNSLG